MTDHERIADMFASAFWTGAYQAGTDPESASAETWCDGTVDNLTQRLARFLGIKFEHGKIVSIQKGDKS